MAVWTFLDFVESDGSCPIADWLNAIGSARAAIDQRLLVQSAVKVWNDRWIKKYKSSDGIYELRISWNRVEYRVFGTYRPGYQFVLLEGAIEKGMRLPPGSIQRAEHRRETLLKEPSRVRRHQFTS
jgi:hypothetical protein